MWAVRRPTMTDIARELGISKNTVSLAMRNDPQIPLATRKKVNAVAERLGYQRDPLVAHLMARLRSTPGKGPKATLALLNANQSRNAFVEHPTIPAYIEGCQRRAGQLGYALDSFWMHDPELNGTRLNRILKARGIRGVVVVGLMKTNRLPHDFDEIWQHYPCVVTGVRTRDPALPFACVDHHIVALRAFEQALGLGYKRPALVLDRTIDELIERRFTAGYHIGQQSLPQRQRLRPFYDIDGARENPSLFHHWLEREKPDVIFTLYNVVRDWLCGAGWSIPDDIGLIQLEWRKDRPDWAGMDQHNDRTGEAAIDMVISMIHGGERGVPPYPRATLIGGSWVEGATVKGAC